MTFLLGVALGMMATHLMYLMYFHFFVFHRIESVVGETRKWFEELVQSPEGQPPGLLSMLFPACPPSRKPVVT